MSGFFKLYIGGKVWSSFKYYIRRCPKCNRLHKTKTKGYKAICFECDVMKNRCTRYKSHSFEIIE